LAVSILIWLRLLGLRLCPGLFPILSLCEDSDCDHTRFALSIPKVIEALKEKGWKIESGRIIYVPP